MHWAAKRCENMAVLAALLADPDIDTTCRDALDLTPYELARSDAAKHLIYQHMLEHRGKDIEVRITRGRKP